MDPDAAGASPTPPGAVRGAGTPAAPGPGARRTATRRTGSGATRAAASSAEDVARQSAAAGDLPALEARVEGCRACPRLVEWREHVAVTRRRAFSEETYWGRPLPGFGDPEPRLLVIGLAPAAHGANRTGRLFTGDRSGDWLFQALYEVGVASQPHSVAADDGLRLRGTRLVAAVRCAPPGNAPTTVERDTCAPWLHAEVGLVAARVRAVVALGGFAWAASLRALDAAGWVVPRPRPRFGHGAAVRLSAAPRAHPGAGRGAGRGVGRGVGSGAASAGRDAPRHDVTLLGCYHPSQQNTFTGRLTREMLRDVLAEGVTVGGITAGSPVSHG